MSLFEKGLSLSRLTDTPAADDPAGPIEQVYVTQRPVKILVVDDEPPVLASVSAEVEQLGYSVVGATNGPEALKKLQADPDIALLLTDIVMPGALDGFGLAERAKQQRPELKVVYTSGYIRHEGVWYGTLLPKPWRSDDLDRAIKAALGQT